MTTGPATTIRRADKSARMAGFERLLNEGIAQVQALSGARWTDHNLHDPGITVLEQLCFALSELAYRADFEVADHLTGPDGRIHFEALALHGPRHVFSCRATTTTDLRHWLLDRVPGLDDARWVPLSPKQSGASGVYKLQLRLAERAATAGAGRSEVVKAAYAAFRAQRNLGEDVDAVPLEVKDRACRLHADIEIGGPRDAVEVMAEVYHRAAGWIDRHPRRCSRLELEDRGLAVDEIYDGPEVEQGFFDPTGHGERSAGMLYLADLAQQLEAIPGVQRVQDLALEAAGRRHTAAVAWLEGGRALRLQVPGEPEGMPGVARAAASEPESFEEMGVVLRRRHHEAKVPRAELWRRVQNLQLAERSQRRRLRESVNAEEAAELPRGRWREPAPYHSVQHHFPALYGLGRHGLPASASPHEQARSRQLRSYLLLFEQILANGEAQVAHLRDLFSVSQGAPQSYWWQPLGDDQVPGLQGLLMEPAEALGKRLREVFDRSSMRKSRLLDHLLALHGETFSQNALRQYCGHLRADEVDRHMLENKAAFLREIVGLSRDRAGGFDDSRPLWGGADNDNNSGLARRVSLLLGFRYTHARSLTRALAESGLSFQEDDDAHWMFQAGESDHAESVEVADCPEEDWKRVPDPRQMMARQRLPLLGPMLRAGAAYDAYRLLPLPTLGAPAGDAEAGATVLVGPDDRQRWWRLGSVTRRTAARAVAARCRRTFIDINDECEGLHVLEHVLLRPLLPDSPAHAEARQRGLIGDDFFGPCVSVVMPGWTVRTHQRDFRALAEETLQVNLPVHLSLRATLWLEFAAMVDFEGDYERWLDARRAWCAAPEPGAARRADLLAARLLGWLNGAPPTRTGGRDERG